MKHFEPRAIEQYLESIPGVMVIRMDGTVSYLNRQCAGYLGVEQENAVGQPVLEVFPQSKMMEGLSEKEGRMVFYSTNLGIGISIQVPIFENGIQVGLLEYDVTQDSEKLYDLSDGYSRFLDNELKQMKRQIFKLEGSKYSIHNLVGSSRAIQRLKEQILSAARSNSTVLITGETGTGKELVAHAIHSISSRRKHRLVRVNASAIPENLMESELFGYEGGSFTGAFREGKKGKFELANNSTLFIDEINQMPLSAQPKLLRVIQEKEVDRIGSDKTIDVDVRIITASNENLKEMVEARTFREDLYYRLNVLEIRIPPLRERLEDLEETVAAIIENLNQSLGMSIQGIDGRALELLKNCSWPGNVRQLNNAVERAMHYASSDVLTAGDFSDFLEEEQLSGSIREPAGAGMPIKNAQSRGPGWTGWDDPGLSENPIEEVKRRAEREYIIQTLLRCGGNKSKTARELKISRPLLYQKMKRLGIRAET